MDGIKLPDFSKPAVVAAPQVTVDPLAEQTEQSVALMAGMQNQELDARQKAMSEFLTKMQKELGVAPDKVLQAFSEMDLDELAETPQNTVGAFVQGLNLDPAGQVKAADLYKTMLDKRGETILPEKLATLDDDVTFDIASKNDIKLRELDKSLAYQHVETREQLMDKYRRLIAQAATPQPV